MDLNTILIILGVSALVILVIHGIWSSRREASRYCKSAETFTNDSRLQNRQKIVDDTLSDVVSSSVSQPFFDDRQQTLSFENENVHHSQTNEALEQIKVHLPSANEHVEEVSPPISSMSTVNDLAGFNNQEYSIDTHSVQLREQLAELEQNNQYAVEDVEKQSVFEPVADVQKVMNTQYLMLYVVAAEGSVFQGTKLAKILDELGFLFGEKQIYHRHSDLNINSPILFSVANIELPGTFHYNMQDFSTIGIALFIQFPSEGNDLMNLRMMIQAAKSIAEELEGFVLTAEQKIFDEQEEHRYLDFIR